LAAGSAGAQQPQPQQQTPPPRTIARLVDVQGNVLVTQEDAMVAGVNDQKLPAGARVLTTAGAKVTISYDKGCDVRLEQNRRFEVRELGECAALIASVESLGPASGAIGGGATGVATGGIGISDIALAGILAGTGVGVYEALKSAKQPQSPN
jgi:hypothetical protein